MSHNLVTEIKKTLTCSKVGPHFAFNRDRSSKLTLWLSTPTVTWEPSPYLRPYPISVWKFTSDALCRGEGLRVQQASHHESVPNAAPGRANEPVRIWVTVVSLNPA